MKTDDLMPCSIDACGKGTNSTPTSSEPRHTIRDQRQSSLASLRRNCSGSLPASLVLRHTPPDDTSDKTPLNVLPSAASILTPRLISRRSKLRFSVLISGSRPKRSDTGTHDPRIFHQREESVNNNFPPRGKQHGPGYDRSPGRGSCGSVARRAQCASGSGRTWKCTAMGVRPLPPSTCHGARSPLDTHNPLPFQPASGSSIRPSRPLA
jgi:hypothetical protein